MRTKGTVFFSQLVLLVLLVTTTTTTTTVSAEPSGDDDDIDASTTTTTTTVNDLYERLERYKNRRANTIASMESRLDILEARVLRKRQQKNQEPRADTSTTTTTTATTPPNPVVEEKCCAVSWEQYHELKKRVNIINKRTSCIHGQSNERNLRFSGCNVLIQNGSKARKRLKTATKNSRGNLAIGYNERGCSNCLVKRTRVGSHNVVLGKSNEYREFASVIIGQKSAAFSFHSNVHGNNNFVFSPFASAKGGEYNQVEGYGSTITGGEFNFISGGDWSIIHGGDDNEVEIDAATIVAGDANVNDGDTSAILGGYLERTDDDYQTVPAIV